MIYSLVNHLTKVYKSFYVLIQIVMIENVNAKLLKVLTCVHIVGLNFYFVHHVIHTIVIH